MPEPSAIVPAMSHVFGFNIAALASLMPAALFSWRSERRPDLPFWLLLGLAAAGPALWAFIQLEPGWHTNISTDLWVGIGASMALFLVVCFANAQAWRLAPLLLPYLILLGLFAALFASVPGEPLSASAPAGWLDLHILVSVATLALLTVAAVAALSSFLQSRALKNKRQSPFSRSLLPLAESERLFEALTFFSELVLGLGVATGMATQYVESGNLLKFDHKTLLSLMAFAVIGALLIGRRVCGVRGQMAARVALLAYLLLILGYFGVKFVKQVLLG